ncbi:MAG: GNAT family N-acetyltransferase [Bacteroidota bacterium]|nr:GNAT family N-acetyltransferase [Bacteroidota bacterium]
MSYIRPVILQTDRLYLRRPTPDDAAFMLRLVNEPSWIEYIGDRKVHTLEDARNYLLNGTIKSFETYEFGFAIVILKQSDIPIGTCGFAKRDYLEDVDFGFAFYPEYTGQGYAYEAAFPMLEWGKDHLGFKKVVAITVPNNLTSIKLLEKLGFYLKEDILVEGDVLNLYSKELDV